MRTAVLFAFVVALSAVAAPVPKAVKKQDDVKSLQGQWASITLDSGSGHKPDTSFWLIVEDDKMWMGVGTPTKRSTEYTFTLDPSQSPKHLNLTSKGGGQQGWIYEIDGDTLTWCHPSGNGGRSTGMKSEKPYFCTVWKRVKE